VRKRRGGEGPSVFRRAAVYSPDLHVMISGEGYRDVFFDPDFFFMRIVAFFAGFFLAALAMRSPPLK
jgi:hypothetical protein